MKTSMIKNWAIVYLVILSPFLGICQSDLAKGSKYASVKFGSGRHSTFSYYQGDLGWMYDDKLGLRLVISFENANLGSTEMSLGRINFDNSFTMFNVNDRLHGSAILGVYLGYESIASSRDPLSERNLVFGVNGGIELNYFLTRKFSLRGEFLQYYVQNSSVSPLFYTGTLGISYQFN